MRLWPDLGKRKRQAGFTLIELLVGISILTLVTGAVVASFAAGVRVWSAALAVARTEEATRAELAVWGRDVMNARRFRGHPFAGEAQAMTFAVVQPIKGAADGTFGDVLSAVRYWHDAQEQALFRQTRPFPSSGPWVTDEAERWIDRVGTAVFEYSAVPEDGPAALGAVWLPAWQEREQHPLGVRLRLTMVDGSVLVRTVILPARQWQRENEVL